MISQETVWQEIWPVVEKLIEATLAETNEAIWPLLMGGQQAGQLYELFGLPVFDILLKTVLGRGRLALTRAIETDEGRYVHIEYVWPDPESRNKQYTAADVVSVQLGRGEMGWQIMTINPAATDLPLTEARAQGILVTSRAFSDGDRVPAEPWILPIALFGGSLQLPLQPTAFQDEVERLLLPGLQHRAYGVLSLLSGRRLWRDFYQTTNPPLDRPAAWAAAIEFIINEQMMREATQAAIAKQYEINLGLLIPRIKQVKKALHIQGLDGRYTALGTTQILLKQAD